MQILSLYRSLIGRSISCMALFFAIFGTPAGAQFSVSPRTFSYASWSLPVLPQNVYLSAISTDSHGQTLAVYRNPAEDSSHHILVAGGGYEDVTIPPSVLTANGFSPNSQAVWLFGSNELGTYVGYTSGINGGQTAFRWNGTSMQAIIRSGASYTEAQAINVNQQVAGHYLLGPGTYPRGYVLDPVRGYRDVLAPGGRYISTVPNAINFQGDVAGTYYNNGAGNSSDQGAFIGTADGRIVYINSTHIYDENGLLTSLKASAVHPSGINRSGEVVGSFLTGYVWRNFYYYAGIFEVLSGPPPSNCPARPTAPKIPGVEPDFSPIVAPPFFVSGIADDGAIYGSADCKYFIGIAPSRSSTPWYAGIASMQRTGPSAQGSIMLAGQVLQGDESITSPNGRYTFTYQADGNLVLYRNADHHALWASNTYQSTVGVTMMQGDGNLVLYNRMNTALFASNTSQFPGAYLRIQDDGNVVVYRSNGQAAWATNTVQNR